MKTKGNICIKNRINGLTIYANIITPIYADRPYYAPIKSLAFTFDSSITINELDNIFNLKLCMNQNSTTKKKDIVSDYTIYEIENGFVKFMYELEDAFIVSTNMETNTYTMTFDKYKLTIY